MTAVIVGIGQPAGGDDAIGLVVARTLAARGFDARTCADASLVLALLAERRRVVIVDAVVGGGVVGTVRELTVAELAAGPAPLSSHGLGVAEALELARTLYGAPDVSIIGIVIAPPTRLALALSPPIAAAIDAAADAAGRAARC